MMFSSKYLKEPVVLRLPARFDPEIRAIAPGLGRKHPHTSEKARRLLEWHPRSAAETVVDSAESLIAWNAV
jgi:dihydroflavonol-4-reductase